MAEQIVTVPVYTGLYNTTLTSHAPIRTGLVIKDTISGLYTAALSSSNKTAIFRPHLLIITIYVLA
jgi:hypothetical protein